MKKYVILFILSITLILIIFAVGYTRVENIDYVRAVRIDKTTAVERLDYSGTVEYADSASATAKGSGVVQAVFASNGDFVEKGDAVLSVYETEADISSSDLMSQFASGGLSSLESLARGSGALTVYSAEKDGIVSGLSLESGGFFTSGQTLFRVSGQQSFQVRLNVSEKDISKIKVGQNVTVDCKALPRVLHGEVRSVGDTASQTSLASGKVTTVKVIVAIDESSDDLKTGYTADCSVVCERREGVLLAPYPSVCTDENGNAFVYIAAESCVKKHIVKTGKEYSGGVEIISGLSDGDIIVYDAAKVEEPAHTIVKDILVKNAAAR